MDSERGASAARAGENPVEGFAGFEEFEEFAGRSAAGLLYVLSGIVGLAAPADLVEKNGEKK